MSDASVLISHSGMVLAFKSQLSVVRSSVVVISRQERDLTDGERIALEELESSIKELNWYLLALRKRIDQAKRKEKHEF